MPVDRSQRRRDSELEVCFDLAISTSESLTGEPEATACLARRIGRRLSCSQSGSRNRVTVDGLLGCRNGLTNAPGRRARGACRPAFSSRDMTQKIVQQP